jgi:hypothetical protein
MPWALVAAAVASFGLPTPWKYWALGGQAGAYLLALADPWISARSVLKKVTSPVRTFAVLMAASACAVAIAIVPAGVLWRETRVAPSQDTSPG